MTTDALDYLSVTGFRSLGSIQKLEIKPINVLIGSNGAGKSNFIGVFEFLRRIRRGELQDFVRASGGAEKILHFGSKTTRSIDLHLSFQNELNQYNLQLDVTDDDSLFPAYEIVSYWEKDHYQQPVDDWLRPRDDGREAGISEDAARGIKSWVQHRLDNFRIYHVHDTSSTSPLRKASNLNDNRYLRQDGANLPAFLYLLKRRYPESYKLIRNSIQLAAPYFEDFLLEPDELNQEMIRLSWKHKGSDQYFDASSLSDGSLRFIALSTLLLQPRKFRPSVILVDEPELGLHPYAITMLASLVRHASETTQVILSTQSAQLLDHFDPAEVLVADRLEGKTNLKRLDSLDLESWLEHYSLGQLWEKNEIGGRPAQE